LDFPARANSIRLGFKIRSYGIVPMPFRIYPEIDAEMLKVMTEPYDAVVARLRLTPDDPRIGKLASMIAQLAKAGVLDADKLADQSRMGIK
jgi:hypothetical protein